MGVVTECHFRVAVLDITKEWIKHGGKSSESTTDGKRDLVKI